MTGDCLGDTESVGRELIALAWPILCSGLLGVLDASVNVMWVGKELGEVGVAALTNANLVWILLFAAAFGLSLAGAVWIGRSLGGGDLEGAKVALGTMVSASGLLTLVCVPPLMIWAHALLGCLGTPRDSLPEGVTYLRTLLLSVPLTCLNWAVISALQAAGDSKPGLYLMIGSLVLDAALNPILIVGVGVLPALGIEGSALATLASQAIGLGALLSLLYGTDHVLCLRRTEVGLLRIDWKRVIALFRQGGPMAVQFLWASIEEMVIISLVNRFGTDITAAYGAMIQIWNFISIPAVAIGGAVTTVIARNVGAGRWDRVRKSARLALAYGVLATGVLAALVELFGSWAYGLFLPGSSASLAFAGEINREATWSLVFLAGYTIWVGVLRAIGSVWTSLGISAAVLAVRFPVTAILAGHSHPQVIWWSFPASAATTVALAGLGYIGLRSQPRLIGTATEQ